MAGFTPLSGILNSILNENAKKAAERSKTDTLANSGSASFSDFSESESEEEEFVPEGDNETKSFGGNHKLSSKSVPFWYWNGSRWADAESVQIGRKFCKKDFTIISWNIWFGLRNRESRMDALGKVVRQFDPDIVAFQEVTSELLKMILAQKWIKEYYISDCDGRTLETYGNIIISKVRFHELFMSSLESRMGRKALLSTLLVKGSIPLTFGTFHLESHLEDAPLRASQLHAFKDLTSNCQNVILVGDTNFTSDTETETLGNRFRDTWRELYQTNPTDAAKHPGLTFDTATNEMAREERPDLKQLRLDRCFYTNETMAALEMKIIGETPYQGNEWISDHYGIMVKLQLKNPRV